ncbi:MAG: DUF4097 family beta strand repeat-containing protein [Terriglobales bacterium]
MASPAPLPPPLPPRHRSFAGPVVLIVIGTVFLLSTMGVLHWEHLGYWFAHWWPMLLILWGVIKLLEYQQAQRAGLRPAGIGAGGIFLLILLICFGLMATQAARFNWDELRDHINVGDDPDFTFFGHNYSFDDQLQQAFPAGASLHVIDDHGAVNVTTSEDNQIHVVVRKRINAENQGDADKWNGGTRPQIMVSGDILTLNANTLGSGDHRVVTDMDVAVPRKVSVVLSTRRGDISVMGRDGDAEITSQKGDVSVTDVTGKVSLNLVGSSARISQISSDVSVEGRPSDVSLDEVKGAVRLTGEFDSLKLSKIAGPVSFKSARTDMEFTKIDGDLDMDSDDLRASDLNGPLHLSTRDKDIRLSGISGDVRLKNENGAVEIRMNKMGSMQVENRSADIQVYLPERAAFQVEARTREGEIQSDFSDLKVSNSDDQGTASGSVGSGGPKLVIDNEHGGIEIRKGSSAPPPPPPAEPTPPHNGKPVKPPAVPEATEN